MKFKTLLMIFLLLSSTQSFARQCWNVKGYYVTDKVHYDLSNTFSQTNNVLGQTKDLRFNFNSGVKAVCSSAPFPGSASTTVRSYETDQAIAQRDGNFQYMWINEYLLGAMQIYDSAARYFYPPVQKTMGWDPNVADGNPFEVRDSDLTLRLKVIKPFVGNISIPSKTMFTVYVTTAANDPLVYPVYTISYGGRITAPQSCTVNSGTVLDIKFGDILASEFNQAGAGNKPASVDPQTRSVSVQCSNMNAAATLTFRIESDKSQGDMLVSNNDNVGFKISDFNDKILIPNNLSSFSEFQLNQNQTATISFKAWPVSVTGKKPAVGPFSSRAYIRIDFP
ncbi:fimbrial protein [Acinetobacter bereziniae]|uniref:fimbrial protein n=1 Tax=Acinetobacter bereziniae TaxID=106648 RepID=UPI001906CD90|nr:fimbrial protein [Acinetobacter bereziniae]MDG3557528.1 fimbrial protein [Acinetobacter bereziniae]MDP6002750.1 fimbrial protein [Acinetobacter bereziniae]QQC79530.1 fimbrial protein [Acinetobacter bereziniae]UUN92608.1 fimbrial protein [Acinetobacter bereziniae]